MIENQKYIYGHNLTEKEIRRKYPFSMRKVKKSVYKDKRYTITFDVLMAYSYRIKGYSVVTWGGTYNGVSVFIFRKSRISARALPF